MADNPNHLRYVVILHNEFGSDSTSPSKRNLKVVLATLLKQGTARLLVPRLYVAIDIIIVELLCVMMRDEKKKFINFRIPPWYYTVSILTVAL